MTENQPIDALLSEFDTLKETMFGQIERGRLLLLDARAEVRRLELSANRLQSFTEAEAAEQLGIAQSTLGGLRRGERVPFTKIDGAIRYTQRQINEIAESFEVRPANRRLRKVS